MTYAWYSGRYNEAQIGANSPVGNPADINTVYQGPAGQGKNFGPGFDVRNYPVDANASVTVPLANIFVAPNLKSPVVREFTTSYGVNLLKGRGYAEGSYVHRRTTDIIEDFISTHGPLVGQRPLHGTAAEQRELRRGGDQHAGCVIAHR